MWFNHPRYLKAKKSFIKELDVFVLKNFSRYLPKILFICGGDPKYCPNRKMMEEYLDTHNQELIFFRAEFAWAAISNQANKHSKKTNALLLEEWLAQFSDAVIILVESFGTVAELGAFSLSEPLRRKLLPILDKKFVNDPSFLNTGPVRWVDNDSVYSPSIYTDFSTILTCMPIVIDRITNNKVYKSRDADDQFGKEKFSRKEFLFFIVYIVTAIGPISEEEVHEISSRTIGYGKSHAQGKEISFILSLAVALELVHVQTYNSKLLYTCIDYKKLYRHKSSQYPLQMSQQLRARCLSDLLHIPEFKNVLIGITHNVG